MKRAWIAAAILALCAMSAWGEPTTNHTTSLEWALPVLNEDGTPLVDLAGGKLYWDTDSPAPPYANSLDVGMATNWTVTVPAGVVYFTGTAYNSNDVESAYCEVVSDTNRVPMTYQFLRVTR